MGMDQFGWLKASECETMINKYLVPTKSKQHIANRLKNLRSSKASENPVKVSMDL